MPSQDEIKPLFFFSLKKAALLAPAAQPGMYLQARKRKESLTEKRRNGMWDSRLKRGGECPVAG